VDVLPAPVGWPQAPERLLETAGRADFLLESFAPGRMSTLGVGYRRLSRANPRLIVISITPFGQNGLRRAFQTSDLVSSAMGGAMSVTGEPGKPPLKPFGHLSYKTAGLFAANAALLALRQREQTGRGQHLDISIHECVAGTLDHVLVRYFARGEVAARRGSLYWNNAFRVFRCRDGYILLTLFYQWDILVGLLKSEGREGLLGDAEWSDEKYRRAHVDTVIGVLEGWAGQHKVGDLLELGQLLRFPWASVDGPEAVLENPQLKARGFFVEGAREKGAGKNLAPGAPVKMSATPWRTRQFMASPFDGRGLR
jgi:crotonobetainyl-CoA:carnitine CoA-transferase CaiB-like acyl-CoA transferase